MAKLDAKFYGVIVKAKDGTIVPEDEYMVFLAKDNAFATILPLYRDVCAQMGADKEHLAAVDRTIERLTEWRARNQHCLKVPDAKYEKLLDQ